MGGDRRESERIFFSRKNGLEAAFTLPDAQEEIFSATLMDLSLKGLGLSFKKGEYEIDVGDHMRVAEIRNKAELKDIADIAVEIRWMRCYDALNHILFGCEFLDISDAAREQIQDFIRSWAGQ